MADYDDASTEDVPSDALPEASLSQRLRDARRTRANEKILQEKSLAERATERLQASQANAYGLLDQAGDFFAFGWHFFARFWRRPFEWKELLINLTCIGSIAGFAIVVVN